VPASDQPLSDEQRKAMKDVLSSQCSEAVKCVLDYLPAYLGQVPASDQPLSDEQRKAIKDVLSSRCPEAVKLIFSPHGIAPDKTYLTFIECVFINLHRNGKYEEISQIMAGIFRNSTAEQIASLFCLTIDDRHFIPKYNYVIKKRPQAKELTSSIMKRSIIVDVLARKKEYFAQNIMAIKTPEWATLLIGAVWLCLWEQALPIRAGFYSKKVFVNKIHFPAHDASVTLEVFQKHCPLPDTRNKAYVNRLAIQRPPSPAMGESHEEYLQKLLLGDIRLNARNKIKMSHYKIVTALQNTFCHKCAIVYEQNSLFVLITDNHSCLFPKICPLCDSGLQVYVLPIHQDMCVRNLHQSGEQSSKRPRLDPEPPPAYPFMQAPSPYCLRFGNNCTCDCHKGRAVACACRSFG
jgi:hypothetical protein